MSTICYYYSQEIKDKTNKTIGCRWYNSIDKAFEWESKTKEKELYKIAVYEECNHPIRCFEADKVSDWILIIEDFDKRYRDYDKYYYAPFIHALHFYLNKSNIGIFCQALSLIKGDNLTHVLKFCTVFTCFNLQNQLETKFEDFKAHKYKELCNAYDLLQPKHEHNDVAYWGLVNFIVDEIKKIKCAPLDSYGHLVQQPDSHINEWPYSNPFLQMCFWLFKEEYSCPCLDIIYEYYPLLENEDQIKLIRKLFHEYKKGSFALTREKFIEYLQRLVIDNKYILFEQYRHALYYFHSKPNIGIKIIVDSILSYGKNGNFQDFNGFIDRTIKEINPATPQVEFGLNALLTICNGGIRRSPKFKGFLSYKVIYEFINEQEFFNKIRSDLRSKLNKKYKKIKENNTWKVKKNKINDLGFSSLYFMDSKSKDSPFEETLLSINQIKEKIVTLYSLAENKFEDIGWAIDIDNKPDFIKDFFKPAYYIFNINPNARIGYKPLDVPQDKLNDRITELTNSIIGDRDDKEYWKVEYNPIVIKNLKYKWLINDRADASTDNLTDKFLKEGYPSNEPCAPSSTKHTLDIIDSTFLWCNARDCYHSALKKVSDQPWEKYDLINFLEILGYDLLKESGAIGQIPENEYTRFRQFAIRAQKIVEELKCHSCNHLLFPIKHRTTFNKYNYYQCVNPNCISIYKKVYLNTCFECKDSLIDSRKTKQCPNKRYICPSCLCCCSNASFEKTQEKYSIAQETIPLGVQNNIGKGHKDRNQHFCPSCGSELDNRICNTCEKSYKSNKDYYESTDYSDSHSLSANKPIDSYIYHKDDLQYDIDDSDYYSSHYDDNLDMDQQSQDYWEDLGIF